MVFYCIDLPPNSFPFMSNINRFLCRQPYSNQPKRSETIQNMKPIIFVFLTLNFVVSAFTQFRKGSKLFSRDQSNGNYIPQRPDKYTWAKRAAHLIDQSYCNVRNLNENHILLSLSFQGQYCGVCQQALLYAMSHSTRMDANRANSLYNCARYQ